MPMPESERAPRIDYTGTGRMIKHLRFERYITIARMQEYLGLESPRSIYKWQRGDVMPSIDNLVGLSALYRVPIDDILVLEGQKQKTYLIDNKMND